MARTIRHGGTCDGKHPWERDHGKGPHPYTDAYVGNADGSHDENESYPRSHNYQRSHRWKTALRRSGSQIRDDWGSNRATKHERSTVRRAADRAAIAEGLADAETPEGFRMAHIEHDAPVSHLDDMWGDRIGVSQLVTLYDEDGNRVGCCRLPSDQAARKAARAWADRGGVLFALES